MDAFSQEPPQASVASVNSLQRRSADEVLLRRFPAEFRPYLFSSRSSKDKPEMVHRFSLTASLPHTDLARHSGISLAFAARLRRFGSRLTGKPSQYDTARHLWPSALRYFKTSQELPASLRIVMENIINRPLHTSPDEMHLLPAAANSDYYFLYAPFFEEHYGFAPAVALSSAVSSLTAALGSSPGSTSNAATSPPAPLVAAAGPYRSGAFVGLPASPDIVGPALSVWSSSLPCNRCRGPHCSWECPIRYVQAKGEPCPGFDERGARIPSAWINGEITPATKAAWKDYITRHNLQQAQSCPRLVNFS